MKLRERAYETFTRHLLAKDIRPGQFISQRELVQLTGLPLGAIREMIPRLEADGLIVTVPQRGMQIANVDLKLVRNCYHLRTVLEKEAVAHYAQRATDAEIEEQIQALARIMRRAETGPITRKLLEEAQAVDWGFHDTVIDSLGNELISDIYRVNSIKIRLIRLERAVLSPEVLLPALREHAEILAAIGTRDPARAAGAMERHMVSARNRAMGIALAEHSPAAPAKIARRGRHA
jgi:DNA-binding GntR family transcriptional regulator